jgi:hypothetical protein
LKKLINPEENAPGVSNRRFECAGVLMDVDVRPCASADEVKQAIAPIANYLGRSVPNEDLADRLAHLLPASASTPHGVAVALSAALAPFRFS